MIFSSGWLSQRDSVANKEDIEVIFAREIVGVSKVIFSKGWLSQIDNMANSEGIYRDILLSQRDRWVDNRGPSVIFPSGVLSLGAGWQLIGIKLYFHGEPIIKLCTTIVLSEKLPEKDNGWLGVRPGRIIPPMMNASTKGHQASTVLKGRQGWRLLHG